LNPQWSTASGTAGVRGVRSRWNYDASGRWAQQLSLRDRQHAERVFWSDPSAQPDQFDAGTLELNQFVDSIDISHAFTVGGLAGQLGVALGRNTAARTTK
jgi:hypothetical protein